jgi:hypothetical protein
MTSEREAGEVFAKLSRNTTFVALIGAIYEAIEGDTLSAGLPVMVLSDHLEAQGFHEAAEAIRLKTAIGPDWWQLESIKWEPSREGRIFTGKNRVEPMGKVLAVDARFLVVSHLMPWHGGYRATHFENLPYSVDEG